MGLISACLSVLIAQSKAPLENYAANIGFELRNGEKKSHCSISTDNYPPVLLFLVRILSKYEQPNRSKNNWWS